MSNLSTDALLFTRAQAITPHDSTNIAGGVTHGIYVGGAGVVVVVFEDNSTCNFTAAVGTVLPVRAKRVNATNTTATLLVALYA